MGGWEGWGGESEGKSCGNGVCVQHSVHLRPRLLESFCSSFFSSGGIRHTPHTRI